MIQPTISISIICTCYTSESFLTSCVPNLKWTYMCISNLEPKKVPWNFLSNSQNVNDRIAIILLNISTPPQKKRFTHTFSIISKCACFYFDNWPLFGIFMKYNFIKTKQQIYTSKIYSFFFMILVWQYLSNCRWDGPPVKANMCIVEVCQANGPMSIKILIRQDRQTNLWLQGRIHYSLTA